MIERTAREKVVTNQRRAVLEPDISGVPRGGEAELDLLLLLAQIV